MTLSKEEIEARNGDHMEYFKETTEEERTLERVQKLNGLMVYMIYAIKQEIEEIKKLQSDIKEMQSIEN